MPPPRTILSSIDRIVNNLPDNTPVYVVVVDFRIKPERETEPGCRVFDRAAFDAHLATVHFKRFDAAVAPMVAAKSVRTLTRQN